MDDFEKKYSDFDWKNTPSREHPRKCQCPRCEFMQEKINLVKQTGQPLKIVLNFCPSHYDVYMNHGVAQLNVISKFFLKLAMKLGTLEIRKLKYMESDICYYCKYGDGGRGNKKVTPYAS